MVRRMKTYTTSDTRAFAAVLAIFGALVTIAWVGLAHAQGHPSKVLQVLMSAPRFVDDLDEPADKRLERLREIEQAILGATQDRAERALLIAQARHESNLARFVHFDWPRCREGRAGWCDGGRAWSLWQLHFTRREGGVAAAARIAIKRLRMHAAQCGHKSLHTEEAVRAALSGYAIGGSCSWSGADERVRTWRSVLARL